MSRMAFPLSSNRQLSRQEEAKLEALPLSEAQYNWMLGRYEVQTPYPNVRDFGEFVKGLEAPDDLICRAEAAEEPLVDELLEELGEMESAWFPTEATRSRSAEIRELLEGALG